MAISFGGMGSGLPPNIVDQLMEVEKIPVKTIEKAKGKEENRLKLITELETKLNAITGSIGGLASARGFSDMKLNSGDTNVVQGAVDPNAAVNGNWNIEVDALAQKAAAITNGFPDKDKTDWSDETWKDKKYITSSGGLPQMRHSRELDELSLVLLL